MAEIADVGPIPDERRCKRSDGRRWRCGRPAMEGKGYCEKHMQAIRRKKKQPVPDQLNVNRARRTNPPKPEEKINGGSSDVPVKRGKRRRQAASDDDADLPRKRGKTLKKEDSISDQSEVVKDLKFGRMEIERAYPLSSQQKTVKGRAKKVGVSSTSSVPRRPIRSKNIEPIPIATIKMLPSIKAAAKKNSKKCHWCKLSSYCVLVKCSTCKEQFFCEDCINNRFYCKKSITRECPVCQGECPCDACTRRNSKKVKAKEPVIYDLEEDVVILDPENEMIVINGGEKFDFSQHLHMIRKLLPVIEKMNQEKIIELDIEAKNKGISHDSLQVQVVRYPLKNECSFCKAGIVDAHRSCPYCPYIICMHCSQEFRDGYLHSSLENLKTTKRVRTKKSRNILWRFHVNGQIRCPPRTLGGCGEGFLNLTSLCPFGLTKDLEESAKQIVCDYKFNKSYGLSEIESPCLLCDKSDEMGSEKVGNVIGNKNKELYFSTKQEFCEKNLDHFMKHWGTGQPLIIQDVLRSQPDLNWDCGFLLCEYLEKSIEAREKTETGKSKRTSDWCEVQFGRKQIFSAGTTHENVWNEFLKFKLRFSSGFLQDHFPNHYIAVIESLPVQEYFNPFTGFLNLAANPGDETENCNLGSYVSISYGGLEKENPTDADLLSNLRCHAYDVVNVLVHATKHSVPERILNEVKVLMNKYNSQNHLKSSRKIAKRNKLEEMFASSSRLDDTCENDVDFTTLRLENTRNNEVVLESESESESESEDEDFSEDVDRCGAQWDVFRREDVPKLLDYLRKYNDKLSRSYGSPKKVVHPLFDEVFYLNDDHKTRLKEDFDVEVWSFEQNVGDAFIIPAGCPYQIKKIKSCVNVVIEFMSPESASESIRLSDEVRLLPVNHKAKGNMLQVKKMVINRMQKTIEEMREVSQIEWSSKCYIKEHLSQTPF